MKSSVKTDVLVIGSGIAGLFAALNISKFADVILITKKERTESNTNYAQGGIASVISKVDSYEKHVEDTLIAGAGLCDKKMVEMMVKEGPDRIKELIELGTEFTRKNDGTFDLAKEGGHSVPRILHAKDLTGREIERALVDAVAKKENILVNENCIAIDLLTEHNVEELADAPLHNRSCWGAYVLDLRENRVVKISAKVTVLATGGLGQVYLHTTNPKIATGDGIAMGYRAGARIANMEFIQFHPTSLFTNKTENNNGVSFLISEAVRGYGAKLITKDGNRFMPKYDEREELAPRDIVARGIDNEIKKSGEEFVLLDVTHKNPAETKNRFPNIYNRCLSYGIDITKDPIPVVPAAHYSCGGIFVDEFARSSLKGLYACGEVSMTGVHGANRLASNSLLEAVVFSKRASIDIKSFLKNEKVDIPEIPDWDDSGTLTADEKILISHNLKELKHTMWDYASIVKSNQRLQRAADRIHFIYLEAEDFYKRTKIFPEILELRNLIACAHTIVKSAKLRRESRGLHYMLDYPEMLSKAENTVIQNTHL